MSAHAYFRVYRCSRCETEVHKAWVGTAHECVTPTCGGVMHRVYPFQEAKATRARQELRKLEESA